jgi:hypothetical protein
MRSRRAGFRKTNSFISFSFSRPGGLSRPGDQVIHGDLLLISSNDPEEIEEIFSNGDREANHCNID